MITPERLAEIPDIDVIENSDGEIVGFRPHDVQEQSPELKAWWLEAQNEVLLRALKAFVKGEARIEKGDPTRVFFPNGDCEDVLELTM